MVYDEALNNFLAYKAYKNRGMCGGIVGTHNYASPETSPVFLFIFMINEQTKPDSIR